MNSADLLTADDKCRRSAYWMQTWEKWALHPNDILRRSIEEAVSSETEDVGQLAGDNVMTYFTNRGVETKQTDLYGMGVHLASLADIVCTVLRGSTIRYERPEDKMVGNHLWESGAFLHPQGTRLYRLVIVDRLSPERLEAEQHAWRNFAEVCLYELPLTMAFVVIGQTREGRHHSPWTRGWLHTVGNQNLRFRKRDGTGLSGAGWKPVWREEADHLSRDKWIDAMAEDGVTDDLVVKVELPVPLKEVREKVMKLAEKKLDRVKSLHVVPEPQPSVCDFPNPCQFRPVCWQFRKEPSQQLGFVSVMA